jgi:hypothetical protein
VTLLKHLLSLLVGASIVACANPYRLEVPNYDHLIGKKWVEIGQPQSRLAFKRIRELEGYEELEANRPDGCAVLFGVRKIDGVVSYWRVTPSPQSCKVRANPLNV